MVGAGQAGGWSSLEALRSPYQQPDDSTRLQVFTHRTENGKWGGVCRELLHTRPTEESGNSRNSLW